ncbi:MAG: hypothetical protein R3F02_04575 [Thiolinea sp.]
MKTKHNAQNRLGMLILAATVLTLTACSDDDDNGQSAKPISEQLANQKANSEPGELNDAAKIKAGIESLFGDPDSEPVDVDTGESIQDVFVKAGS